MKLYAVVPVFLLVLSFPAFNQLPQATLPGTATVSSSLVAGSTASPTATTTATVAPTETSIPVPVTPGSAVCVQQPYNAIVACPVSPTPTRPLIAPTKLLSVGPGSAGPAGSTNYPVSITSRFVCFTLNEPVNVYAISDNPGAVALTAIQPPVGSKGASVSLFPDPVTGTATLALEVFKGLLGPGGLDLKAVWPFEGVERISNVVPAAPPTSTATPVPFAPTTTPTSAPPTGTPGGTTPTAATSAAAQPFSLRACVDPNPVVIGGSATLYAQTVPGAVCTASVFDPEGQPKDFTGAAQTALSDGLVIYPFTVGQTTGQGVAVVQCVYNRQTLRTTTNFTITLPNKSVAGSPTPGPTAINFAGPRPSNIPPSTGGCPPAAQVGRVGLFVLTCITPSPLPFNSVATIYARSVPGALCTPQVIYSNGNQPTSLDSTPRFTDPTGLVSFTFTEATAASSGTANVSCQLGVETAQGTTGFVITP